MPIGSYWGARLCWGGLFGTLQAQEADEEATGEAEGSIDSAAQARNKTSVIGSCFRIAWTGVARLGQSQQSLTSSTSLDIPNVQLMVPLQVLMQLVYIVVVYMDLCGVVMVAVGDWRFS